MKEILAWLEVVAVLAFAAIFLWFIGAAATGDGISDWETQVGIWITAVALGLVGVGRLLEIVTGEDKRR